jgi:hypothetical protein
MRLALRSTLASIVSGFVVPSWVMVSVISLI